MPGGPGMKQCQIKLEEQQRVKGSEEDESSAEESGGGSWREVIDSAACRAGVKRARRAGLQPSC